MKYKKQLVTFGLLFILLSIESAIMVLMLEMLAVGSVKYGFMWMMSFTKIFILSIIILDVFAWFFISLVNSFWVGNSLFIVLFTIFGFAGAQKMKFRQEPIFPSDLRMLDETGSLLKMISIWGVIAVIVACLCLVFLNHWLSGKFKARIQVRQNIWGRLLSLAAMVALVLSFFTLNHSKSFSRQLFMKFGNQTIFWNPATSVKKTGPLLTFINNIDQQVMIKPTNYSKNTMDAIEQRYTKLAKTYNKKRPNSDINKQTLVYILSESFSDPTRVPNMTVTGDPIKNVRKIKQKTTSGLMLSSGYGGGTANMEYMVDTSFNNNFFAPTLTVPFTQLVPNQKKAYAVTDLFNTKNAIHTYKKSFYRRSSVYKKFGFQSFRNIDSTGKEALKYGKTIQNNAFIGDDQAYKNTMWQIKQQKAGQFISTVTMQNHLAYSDKYYDYKYKASGQAVANNADEAKYYIEGIHLTDKSTMNFIRKVDELNKPITIMWYGDHLPGIYQGNSMQKFNIPMHETDYFIYSNKYARKHGYAAKKLKNNTKVVGSNTLTALTLKHMKQKVTPYYAMISDVLEKLPAMAHDSQGTPEGLLVDANNQQVWQKSFTKEQQQLFNDYRFIQYDLIVGNHYLSNDFMTKISK